MTERPGFWPADTLRQQAHKLGVAVLPLYNRPPAKVGDIWENGKVKAQTERVLKLAQGAFKRTLGVKPEIYKQMWEVLVDKEQRKKKKGRTPALDVDDQLVLTLSVWREYRTHHHLTLDWEVDETTVGRSIERVVLFSGKLRLSGRKALQLEVVVVDVAESPIERPKKSKEGTTVEKEAAYAQMPSCSGA